MAEFKGHHVDVVMVANGYPEVGFYGYLEGSHSLNDETACTVLEFARPDGRPVGGVTLTEDAFRDAEWHEVEVRWIGRPPADPLPQRRMLAITLGADRALQLSHL